MSACSSEGRGQLPNASEFSPRSASPSAAPTRISTPSPTATPPVAEAPTSYVTKYEFLGAGRANIVYVRQGSNIIQEQVDLPHEIVLNEGTSPTPSDLYLSASAGYAAEGDIVGCRITLNNVVVKEVLPSPGSISAMCTN